MAGLAGIMSGQGVGNKKINTQTLCDLIGSRYYQHNDEIEMSQEKVVRCFDENDQELGDMTLYEALQAAESAGKDLVMRNAKINPPVVKVMNYKKELLKRLFKKLGKDSQDQQELKTKNVRLTTNISFHDLETRKRQAKGFFKDH